MVCLSVELRLEKSIREPLVDKVLSMETVDKLTALRAWLTVLDTVCCIPFSVEVWGIIVFSL